MLELDLELDLGESSETWRGEMRASRNDATRNGAMQHTEVQKANREQAHANTHDVESGCNRSPTPPYQFLHVSVGGTCNGIPAHWVKALVVV